MFLTKKDSTTRKTKSQVGNLGLAVLLYTDLTGFNANTYKVLWTKKTRSKNLQEFSVPHILNNNFLFTVTHSKNKIEYKET